MSEFTPEELRTAAEVTDVLEGQHRKWITEFAQKDGRSFDGVMAAAKAFLENGTVIDTFDEFEFEFWDHYEALMATTVKDKYGEFYVCCAGSGG